MSEVALLERAPADLPAESAAALHRQLDGLHQMIYSRGGVRPVNQAVEELAKLLLLELKAAEDPCWLVPGRGSLEEVLDPDRIAAHGGVAAVKEAFRLVAALPGYAAMLPGGGAQPIWPPDEPLRIDRADVIAEAMRILRTQVRARSDGHSDVIGTAFDIFLRGRYSHAGGLGTHLTPHAVTSALARICVSGLDLLAAPSQAPVVGDPCCGTGRFLIAAVDELAADRDDPRRGAFIERGLFGADQSASSVAKARVNLLLLGARRPNVFRVEDSILDPHLDALRGQLRLILTNPPFGEGKYDSERGIGRAASALHALAGRRRIDPALAFVVRCLDLLADGGRLGIVLPDGLIDGPVLRKALLGSDALRMRDVSVEANISLPTATFALAGTVARTSALVVRKQAAQRSHIFLARAEHVGFLKQGTTSVPDPHGDDLPAIADAARTVLSRNVADASEGVRFVSRAPLAAVVAARDATSLDPARVDPAAVASRDALRSTGVAFADLLRSVKRRHRAASGSLPFVSVLHIDDLGAVAWHEASVYRPSTPGLEARAGDLIFSLLNPRKLRAAVVPDDLDRVLCSSEFGVFEAVKDPYEVLVLLHHPLVRAQMEPLGRGTSSSRRRITPEDLLGVLAPRLPPRRLEILAGSLRLALEAMREASIAAADAYADATPCAGNADTETLR